MKPIYLDYQATTPADPRVTEAMLPYWTQEFGNPHSAGHAYGRNARQATERARAQIADFIGADDDEIVFTSGATESCNIALRSTAATLSPQNGRRQIITLATEHSAVLATAASLKQQGHAVSILPVKRDGRLDLQVLEAALTQPTLLVSVMLANNEIGVIQSLPKIAQLCRNTGAFIHTDATQAAGRISLDVDQLGVDLLSLSGHKIYGPKGIGILYIRNRPDLTPVPIITGGSQEKGLRPGTVPTTLAVGLGAACQIADRELAADADRISMLTQQLLQTLKTQSPELQLFGHPEKRIPGNLNLGFPNINGDNLVAAVSNQVAISTGAACAAHTTEPSHVLTALGLNHETANTAVRISLGRFTTRAEVDAAGKAINQAVATLNGGQ